MSVMPTTTIAGHAIEVNEEGFLTHPDDWSEDLGAELARLIGIEMTDAHWQLIRFLRSDFATTGETATLRRVSTQTGVDVKTLFALFPKKPAKKMAYVAGLPKPKGCV
jgi:tRNA 2-thiouridine synthesizing protein E